jgi:hypothetical protein
VIQFNKQYYECAFAQVDGKTVKEDSGAYAVTTSSMAMEILAVI